MDLLCSALHPPMVDLQGVVPAMQETVRLSADAQVGRTAASSSAPRVFCAGHVDHDVLAGRDRNVARVLQQLSSKCTLNVYGQQHHSCPAALFAGSLMAR